MIIGDAYSKFIVSLVEDLEIFQNRVRTGKNNHRKTRKRSIHAGWNFRCNKKDVRQRIHTQTPIKNQKDAIRENFGIVWQKIYQSGKT